jgi:hypothetical protein
MPITTAPEGRSRGLRQAAPVVANARPWTARDRRAPLWPGATDAENGCQSDGRAEELTPAAPLAFGNDGSNKPELQSPEINLNRPSAWFS